MDSFSDRMGITSSVKEIQLESMDRDLRTRLWNVVYSFFIEDLLYENYNEEFIILLWHSYFKERVSKIPSIYNKIKIESKIDFVFTYRRWYDVFNVIEFIANSSYLINNRNSFTKAINLVLEQEFSAYRFIDLKFVRISSKTEIDTINNSLKGTEEISDGSYKHLKTAINFLSDRENPSYRNSIKESISAVESIARSLTGEKTLGKALAQLEQKGLQINSQLKEAFNKLYAYTNSPDNGVRHAIMEEVKEPDFEDAKYMLVSCSAFINYLIGKQAKHTI